MISEGRKRSSTQYFVFSGPEIASQTKKKRPGIVVKMKAKKPDMLWILVLVVAFGAASASLMGGEPGPKMAPEQAGIFSR